MKNSSTQSLKKMPKQAQQLREQPSPNVLAFIRQYARACRAVACSDINLATVTAN